MNDRKGREEGKKERETGRKIKNREIMIIRIIILFMNAIVLNDGNNNIHKENNHMSQYHMLTRVCLRERVRGCTRMYSCVNGYLSA